MRAPLVILLALLCLNHLSRAQAKKSVVIGASAQKPNALLILNPENADQGFLAPQLTTSQRMTPGARTFILRADAEWPLISRLTGVPLPELRALNGTEDETARAYQPVRLPLTVNEVPTELFLVGI